MKRELRALHCFPGSDCSQFVVRENACSLRDPAVDVCSETYSCCLLQSTQNGDDEAGGKFTPEQVEEYKEAFALFDRAGIGA
jgi:hypothetical protein